MNQNGPQPILFAEVESYCNLSGIFSEEDRRDIVFFIEALDVVWQKRVYAQISRNREKQEQDRKRESERQRARNRRR